MRLIIIGCVKTKRAGSELVPARELYTSPLWCKRRAYAEASGAHWLILSAEHGLILPDRRIATYDTRITAVRALRRGRTWWHSVVRERLWQLARAVPDRALTLEVHAGAPYVERLREAASLIPATIEIQAPLARLQIGEQLRWYATRREGA